MEQTQQLTLNQKAEIVVALAMFPALTVMIFIRRKIGFRFLGTTKLFAMFVVIGVIGGISEAFQPQNVNVNNPYNVPGVPTSVPNPDIAFQFRALLIFAFVMLALGLFERWLRWQDIKKGVAWHTYSRGISLFSFLPFNDSIIKRYVDPAAVAIVGFVLALVFRWLGVYIIFSAFFLFIFEACDYEQQRNRLLDVNDSLIASEVMSENARHFSQSNQKRPLEQTAA